MVAHDQARLARPWALNFYLAIEQPATTSINLEFFVDIFANPHTKLEISCWSLSGMLCSALAVIASISGMSTCFIFAMHQAIFPRC